MNAALHIANLPEGVRHLAGRILDTDTHEAMPAQLWGNEIDPVMQDLADHWIHSGTDSTIEKNHPNVLGYKTDDQPIDAAKIWKTKGCASPGAADVRRRIDVMDIMGVKRQLMYPGAGIYANFLVYLDPSYGFASDITAKRPDLKAYGYEAVKAYNKWGIKVAKWTDRVRPVLPVVGETFKELMDNTEQLVTNGIRAVWMMAGKPPGGVSPADPEFDAYWDMLEKHKVTLCFHGGLESKIFGTDVWWDVPAFKGYKVFGEFRLDPWSMAHTHTPIRNFLLTMVLGGVFERHPTLRVSITEAGADWLGHLCDHLDLWHSQDLGGVVVAGERVTFRLSAKPSYYIKRNVRATPFDFEPVDKYIRQYDLGDVLCFASDYPHVEGGFDPATRNYDRVKPFGDEMVEKFFVGNAEWILPE
jgi:predicted TIM-barrel fold metal-dependent hydrolase